MRISIFVLVAIIIGRMIYDLTFNPLEAIINMIYKNGSEPKKIAKQVAKIVIPCILLAITWTAIMPNIMAYYNQPFEEETHVIGQMPMYGNRYLEMKEGLFGSRKYRYMIRGDEDFSETDKGARTHIIKSDTGSNSINIIYQNPRRKELAFFFMDALTWPTQRKNIEYTFSVVYD